MPRVSFCCGLLLLIAMGCNQPAEIPLKVTAVAQRDDNLLEDDRYYLDVNVYHSHSVPVSGTLTVRAYGDVFGTGGEEAWEGDNYDLAEWTNVSPGTANGTGVLYYINNPQLKENDLPEEVFTTSFDMALLVEFQPADLTLASRTSWLLLYRDGTVIPANQLSNQRPWLEHAGVPAQFIPSVQRPKSSTR